MKFKFVQLFDAFLWHHRSLYVINFWVIFTRLIHFQLCFTYRAHTDISTFLRHDSFHSSNVSVRFFFRFLLFLSHNLSLPTAKLYGSDHVDAKIMFHPFGHFWRSLRLIVGGVVSCKKTICFCCSRKGQLSNCWECFSFAIYCSSRKHHHSFCIILIIFRAAALIEHLFLFRTFFSADF